MPKRINGLYEKFLTESNFILAEKLIGKNKPDNKMAKHIGSHAERYGKGLFERFSLGKWHCHESKLVEIVDGYKGKIRQLKIPCLEDQAVQQAWLNIAAPYIEKRNYYYNCGSIPNAGQTRAVYAVKEWLRKSNNKYASITDIRKFYDTCPHWAVIKGLRRIFKDEAFIEVAKDFLCGMNKTGRGLAMGHPTSHWFANVALMEIDHELKRLFPKVKMVRYMDDRILVSTNKRLLQRCVRWYKEQIEESNMELKKWQTFKIEDRGISFLSYRFFHNFTILVKKLMYRISRRFVKAAEQLDVHTARGLLSYMGILKHCNSYNFKCAYVYPNVNIKVCRRLISNYDKNILRSKAA